MGYNLFTTNVFKNLQHRKWLNKSFSKEMLSFLNGSLTGFTSLQSKSWADHVLITTDYRNMFCVIFVLHLSQLIPSIFHMYKLFGEFLESNYKFCHSPADMLPAYKAAGTKPSLCLADRFGEYGAHSCSSGDRCSSLAGAYFCTYKNTQIWLEEVGDSEKKTKQNKCLPSQRLLQLYLSMLLFTSAPSFLHLALLPLLII